MTEDTTGMQASDCPCPECPKNPKTTGNPCDGRNCPVPPEDVEHQIDHELGHGMNI